MSRIYDNWERLVAAVLKKEELRRIALCPSFDCSISTDFSVDSYLEDVSAVSGTCETIDPGASSSSSVLSYREVKPIEYTEIKKATKNFRHDLVLGEGGFGPVFKGWIDEDTLNASKPGFGIAVAAKIWRSELLRGRHEWLKELNYLSQLRHPNIIKLMGYCKEEDNLILVYEFMPKGSLVNHLFTRWHQSLSWTTRIKVAIDVARGLSFLHETEIPVIHRCFHTAHILLDAEFNAKLSDFGLAWNHPTGLMSDMSTRLMGTYGYAAPEYIATGHLTTKCDVYGYGVVLLELLCGRRAFDKNRGANEENLVEWAKPYLGDNRKLFQVMDTKLEDQYPLKQTRKVAMLALRCLSNMPKLRPSMTEILVALEQL
ncbi:hypothetical protein BUALT_BualtUnG0011200 [Buddleja alternifolia]|uniref:non-specific serine/threonine protein kinase n=1 Tax=Buddleja alternifolia TaxID=168488 RepID=A0AAV6W7W2_9LAMI|nr:hypothetical protein BUALT_BualtUnG0011200 [Buddleja alternifolia]